MVKVVPPQKDTFIGRIVADREVTRADIDARIGTTSQFGDPDDPVWEYEIERIDQELGFAFRDNVPVSARERSKYQVLLRQYESLIGRSLRDTEELQEYAFWYERDVTKPIGNLDARFRFWPTALATAEEVAEAEAKRRQSTVATVDLGADTNPPQEPQTETGAVTTDDRLMELVLEYADGLPEGELVARIEEVVGDSLPDLAKRVRRAINRLLITGRLVSEEGKLTCV